MKEKNYFFILFLVSLIVHLFLPLNWGDDSVFNAEAVLTLKEFLYGTSRLMTDTMTYIFCRWHILWRLINPAVLTLLAKTLCELVPAKNNTLRNILFCTLPIYPTMVLVDAGFIATTVNYLWPITFAFVNILTFQNIYRERKFRAVYLLTLPLLFYALNMEMMSAVLCFVFCLGVIIMIKNKRFNFFPVIQALVSIAGLLTAYLGNLSGDDSRMVREIGRYFPEYQTLNLFNKIELGFSSTFYCMTMKLSFASVAFIAFSAFLMYLVFKTSKSVAVKLTATFPCVFATVFSIISVTPLKDSGLVTFLTGGMQNYKMNKAVYSFEPVPDILFLIIAACTLFTVGYLLHSKADIIKAFFILAVGLGTRMIMVFSPTVWASGYRTFAVFIMAVIIVTVMLADKYCKPKNLTES